eukprot:Gregarina_sp_Poly_1__3176@NODE_18_length_21885_cov_39_980383_g16_i0_p7_GENE_NODE_18_length_21885_cov_39_980383_g16_i0NODE_18_length_21885_cov_39_980383_g16_i0_p7_ORF_typecomplete_len191_score7_64_NODE_18_length_21885_cov_39_980383_g16_i01889819470
MSESRSSGEGTPVSDTNNLTSSPQRVLMKKPITIPQRRSIDEFENAQRSKTQCFMSQSSLTATGGPVTQVSSPQKLHAPKRNSVDYVASMVEGHWIATTPISNQTSKQKIPCRQHFNDHSASLYVCDCPRRNVCPTGCTWRSQPCSLRCHLCGCPSSCCCCRNDCDQLPPYPADFSRTYQTVAYYFRSAE